MVGNIIESDAMKLLYEETIVEHVAKMLKKELEENAKQLVNGCLVF